MFGRIFCGEPLHTPDQVRGRLSPENALAPVRIALNMPQSPIVFDRALLRRRAVLDFDTELEGLSRAEQAVAFLALLELRRSNEIAISQAAPFAPIRILRAGQESPAANERTPAWNARSA